MIQLSYTTLNSVREASHTWINKMLGIKREDKPWYGEGREAHKIIQQHVSGKTYTSLLAHINDTFPVVEKIDYDPDCKFSLPINDKYCIIGFLDGLDPINKRFLEIKTSKTPWSIMQFQKAMQRKIYALAHPDYTEAVLITGARNPSDWKYVQPKVYKIPLTQKDRDEAMAWIMEGIDIIEKGDFTGGLDSAGKCEGCSYGNTCHFL